jgi:O-antigen/teichoic acid export membrane protein
MPNAMGNAVMIRTRSAAAATIAAGLGGPPDSVRGVECEPQQTAPAPIRRLAQQTGWSALGSFAIIASRFIIGIVIARLLGPNGTGRLAYLLWLAETMNVVASFGLQTTAARFIADLRGQGSQNGVSALAHWLYVRYFALALIGSTLIAVCASLADFDEIRLWQILAAYFLMQSLGNFYTAYLSGNQRFDVIARLNLTSSLVLILTTTVGTVLFGLGGAVAGYLAGALPNAIPSFRLFWAHIGYPGEVQKEVQKSLRRRCLKYAVYTWAAALVSAMVWSRIEIFFLNQYCGAHMVAMFTVGMSLSSLATQGPLLLTGPLMPHFANLVGTGNQRALCSTYANSTRLLAAMLLPLCFGLVSITPALLPLLYGRSFAPAVPTAMVLIACSALSVATVGSSLIYGMERSSFIAAGGAVGAALSLLSCILVIPRWGTWGAAWCRCGVQTSMILLSFWYIQTRLSCPVPWRALARTFLAASVSAIPSYLIVRGCAGLGGITAAILLGACAYIAAARYFRVFGLEDMQLVEGFLTHIHPALRNGAIFVLRCFGAA